ncbi:MAG: plastocyanin/azurin family copper-binding protein [Gemmatimonadales bacterium]
MRKQMLAGLASVGLMACGGDKAANQPAQDSAATAAPAAAPAGGGVHTVTMEFDGTNYKFVPNDLTIKAGDQVLFKSVSGGPHNVQFFADSMPAASIPTLVAAMTAAGDKLDSLSGPLKMDGEDYSLSFAGVVAGVYKLTCTPHQAMAMNMVITVQ